MVSYIIIFILFTDDGGLFSCGLNQHGQCGIGYLTEKQKGQIGVDSFKLNDAGWVVSVCQPLRVGGLPAILEAHCGWSHVVAITGEITEQNNHSFQFCVTIVIF